MTKTEELLKLVEAVIEGDASIGTYYDACDPHTIKQLVELVRLQNRALKGFNRYTKGVMITQTRCQGHEAIAAYERFEKGE